MNKIKPSLVLTIFIWVSSIFCLLGELFKIYHYPGASALLVLGSLFFAFFYIPLFTVEIWKEKETKKSKAILIIQSFFLFLFAIGFVFKIQHWPLSGLLYFINNVLLVFVVVPYAFYHLAKARKENLFKTHAIFLCIYFFCLSIGSLTNSSSGKIGINTVVMQGVNTERALKSATSRNLQLYSTLKNIQLNSNSILLNKVNRLKTITDSSITYVKNLQTYLLSKVDNISKSVADTLSSADISNTNNYDIPSMILIRDEFNLSKEYYSASKLKSVINLFKDTLLSLVQEQNRAIINEGLNLNTSNHEDSEGEPVSWEIENFYHIPFLSIFNTLTNINYEIRNAEYQALTDIINSDSKDLNTALFSQIADLNSKFDAVKKQEEIKKLKNENEKGLELLKDKNSQLSDSQQTIIYFVFATVIFLALIFFVIRTNYLRRQANKTLVEQKQIIEVQKNLVEEKQREILDSIEYALRIQTAILPPQKIVKHYLENSFILYKPKDIVAGDFYWMETVDDLVLFAACDCTGHGVPGAMVSVVCHNALNRAVREFGLTKPAAILDKTAEIVIENFSKSEEDIKDGMDVSICTFNTITRELQWAGANNPLWIMRTDLQSSSGINYFLQETRADKQPIGMHENRKPFTNHVFTLNSGDTLYLFTDGFADQFGGDTGEKKLTRKRFKDLLLSIQNETMNEQELILNKFITEYRKEIEQIDDILVMGIKV